VISSLYNFLIYQPLYNGLIFLIKTIPWADVGVAVVLLTIIVKLILFPLSRKAIVTQRKIKQFNPEINEIKKKYSKDRQEQAKKMFELYKEKGINPFSSFFLILIQLPVIFALYRIFWQSGLPEIQSELVYSFITAPLNIDMVFLGLVDVGIKSWPLALLVGLSTFFQMRLSMPVAPKPKTPGKSLKDDLARSMSVQMRYVFPFLAAFISYSLSGAIALYWLTSNLFTITQELILKRRKIKVDGGRIGQN
jgi:YidC/Oxa1 family membrane protein insertase